MINSNSKLYAHVRGHLHTCCTLSDTPPIHLADNITREISFCLFVCLFAFGSDVSLACYVCVCTYLWRITAHYIHTVLFYLCLMCTAIQYHTCMQVGLCLCVLMCVHIHILYVHMPLCHREKGGVSIFPSPFFGDNDGHFFFSVTDDRQN